MEQQAIYQKYGSSPFGGCLPILIMLPIIIALYRVIYAVPAYVTDVKALYNNVASSVTAIGDEDADFSDKDITKAIYEFYKAEGVTPRDKKNTDTNFTNTDLIDIFSVYNTAVWDDFRSGKVLTSTDKEGNSLVEQPDGTILINGEIAQEYTFKQDYYFMMGDNRHNSLDSRYWGFVPEDHIVGRPSVIWLSTDRGRKFPKNIRWRRFLKFV